MDDGSTDLVRDSQGSYHATPNNFDELYDEGVIGKALNFDGVNDYLDMSLGAHPPSGTEQLTISFWSKGVALTHYPIRPCSSPALHWGAT